MSEHDRRTVFAMGACAEKSLPPAALLCGIFAASS